jgi:rSAM/selenodomain-associated transferase 2
MRLSIVVPVLDEVDRLGALLAELSRSAPGVEVIVVDGGSRDGSPEIAAQTPGVRLVSGDRGRARQMNAGAARAAGETLLFLHADTHLPPGAVEAVQDALVDPSVVYGRFDVRFDRPGAAFRMIARLMNLRSRLTGISTGDQAIFVRRSAFERLGGYPEIALMEDVELTRRLKRIGRFAPLRLQVTTAARRWEKNGIARTIVLMWTLRVLYFCGIGPDRLHRWYYGAPARERASGRRASAPVVLDGAAAGVVPPPPPARPLHAASQEHGGDREQEHGHEGRPEPAVGVGAEPADRALLNDEPHQHGARPEQRSTSHGSASSLRQGRSEARRPP